MSTVTHLKMAELEQNLEEIRRSPQERGQAGPNREAAPDPEKGRLIEAGELTVAEGLVGDNWSTRTPGCSTGS